MSALLRPTLVAGLVTFLAAILSYTLPPDYAATGVGALFCIAVYWLSLRHSAETIEADGLRLGGIFAPEPLSLRRLGHEGLAAVRWAGVAGLVFFPAFTLAYGQVWAPSREFVWASPPSLDEILGQILVTALPEEMFYRGYLQSAFDRAVGGRVSVLGAQVGAGVLLASVVFALGHVATRPDPARLAVFFPSLVFGWLRARTGGIGGATLFHAGSNLLSSYLAHAYFGHP